MIETRFGRELKTQLRSVVPDIDSDPHALLRAYCSFLVSKTERSDCSIDSSNPYLRKMLFPDLLDGAKDGLCVQFLDWSALDFLRFVTPFEAISCMDYSWEALKEKYKFENELHFMLTILVSKEIRFENVVKSRDSRSLAFDEYNERTRKAGIPRIRFPKNYYDFLFWLFCFDVEDFTETLFYQPSGKADRERALKAINDSASAFFDDFNQNTRDNAADALKDIHSKFCNCKEDSGPIENEIISIVGDSIYRRQRIFEHFGFTDIARTDPAGEGYKLLDTASSLARSFFTINVKDLWFDVLCAFHTTQRGRIDIRKAEIIPSDRGSDRRNDVALELTVLYTLTTSNIGYGEPNYIIILPSPYFIDKYLKDKCIADKNWKAMFVVENSFSVDLLEARFFNANNHEDGYVRKLQKKVRFVDIHDDEWMIGDYTDVVVNEPLISEADFPRVRDFIIKTLESGNDQRIVSLCADTYMQNPEKSLFSNIRHTEVKNMILFPEGIGGTEPLMKNIWIADNSDEASKDWADIYQFAKQTRIEKDESGHAVSDAENRRLFCRTDSPAKVDLGVYVENGRTIRAIVKDARSEKTRSTEEVEYRFCNEVSFRYHRTLVGKNEQGEDLYKYRVGFVDSVSKTVQRKDGSYVNYTSELKGLLHRPNGVTSDYFAAWIEENYIEETYSVRKGKRKEQAEEREADKYDGKTIRAWISDRIGRRYKGAIITLRALWVFYPDIKDKAGLSNRETLILKEYVFNSELGNKYLNKISIEEISDFYESRIRDAYEVLFDVVQNLFSKVFCFAVKLKHCTTNPFQSVMDSGRYVQKIRSALVKKIFLVSEYRKLYRLVIDDVKHGDPVALGILVRMMTGISTAELKSLRWSDVIEIAGYGDSFYALQVFRRTDLEGAKTQNLPSPENVRIIPLGRKVGEMVKTFRGGRDSQQMIMSEDGSKPISNSKVAKKMNAYFGKLGLDDNHVKQISISIPDDKEGFSECILTKYGGDILRENYRYWSTKAAGFSVDEIDAILGISRFTTLGRFYVDFNADQTLLYMHVKQCRLEAFLESDDERFIKASNVIMNRLNSDNCKTRFPLQLDMYLQPGCQDDAEVTISNRYGMCVDRLNIITEEDEQ